MTYLLRYQIVILTLALGCGSCIDQISADLPAPPKVLVMNSISTPDSVFRVQVSRVASTVDSTSRLLSSARVYLVAPGRRPELLRNQGRGLYASVTKPTSGVPYTLRVEADDYPLASATDTVPAAVPIREGWYSYPTGTDRNQDFVGTIVVRFDDPAPTANFYELIAYQVPTRSLPQLQDFVLDARGNAALAAEGDTDFEPASLVSLISSSMGRRLSCGPRLYLMAAAPVASLMEYLFYLR
jgi:hypothetical protein